MVFQPLAAGLHGMQFVQTPGQLVELVDANHDFRVIPTDGRPHTENPDPTFNGEERGHWERDTLVIDTIAIDERVWNSANWRFHSDQEHVIERYSRPSLNYLIYQVYDRGPQGADKTLGLRPSSLFAIRHPRALGRVVLRG